MDVTYANVTDANLTTNVHHCNICEKTYRHKKDLTRHIKNVHKVQGNAQIEHYNTADTERSILQKHSNGMHNNMNMTYANVMDANLTTMNTTVRYAERITNAKVALTNISRKFMKRNIMVIHTTECIITRAT